MLRENCRQGMTVLFGRTHGEKTLGKVVKVNPAKAKVETLENRGGGKGCAVGSTWLVPYSLMEPVDEKTAQSAAPKTPPVQPVQDIKFNPFQSGCDQHIMQAILCCYAELSPENLTCDGELPAYRVTQKRNALAAKLRHLFAALGQEVSEEAAYRWEQERRDSLKTQEELRKRHFP